MLVFELVIALLLGGAVLSAAARYLRTPYPALVALAGAALAIVPGLPTLVLDPELALTLFVAPVLLDAAFDASPRDLRANWRTVAGLALGAVVLTVLAVAAVMRWLVPDMPLAAAIALGAIVAPPDAAAATAVLRQLRPPHRLLVILEGESLFNDASALLIYRFAVGVMVGGVALGWNVVPALLLTTVGSVGLGLVLSRVLLALMSRISDVSTAVIAQFTSTFAVWILAERLHLSGILTTVVYAMATSRRAGDLIPARIRIPSYAVWEVAVFVLNVLAFILVGLQLRTILARVDAGTLSDYLWIAAAVCVAVMLARLAWVAGVSALERLRARGRAGEPHGGRLSRREAGLVGWCGMRGIVTLAAALALPDGSDGGAFPYRDLILLTAFSVVLVTLVVQGMTLRPMLLWLRLEDDGAVEREVRNARVETARAALEAIEACSPSASVTLVRDRYAHQLSRAEAERSGPQENGRARQSLAAIEEACAIEAIEAAMRAERQRLLEMRASSQIGDAAFQQVEQEIDWAELDLRQWLRVPSA